MPPIFALLLLAVSPIPGTDAITNDQAQLITWGIAGVILVICMQALSLVFAGVKAMRRTPPLHETYATKVDLKTVSERLEKIETSTNASLNEIFRELRTIGHSLGRLEGKE